MNTEELNTALAQGFAKVNDTQILIGWASELLQKREFDFALQTLHATHQNTSALEEARQVRDQRLALVQSHVAIQTNQRDKLLKKQANAKQARRASNFQERSRNHNDGDDQDDVERQYASEIERLKFVIERLNLEREVLTQFLPSYLRQSESAHHETHQKAARMLLTHDASPRDHHHHHHHHHHQADWCVPLQCSASR
jgi:hypothetical protein